MLTTLQRKGMTQRIFGNWKSIINMIFHRACSKEYALLTPSVRPSESISNFRSHEPYDNAVLIIENQEVLMIFEVSI